MDSPTPFNLLNPSDRNFFQWHCFIIQGDNCEEHTKAQLAKTVDAMLATTLRLPTLSDVAYDIEDLREYVGISFGAIQSAISELEASFKRAFDDLGRKLTNQFQWSNLITYTTAVQSERLNSTNIALKICPNVIQKHLTLK